MPSETEKIHKLSFGSQ